MKIKLTKKKGFVSETRNEKGHSKSHRHSTWSVERSACTLRKLRVTKLPKTSVLRDRITRSEIIRLYTRHDEKCTGRKTLPNTLLRRSQQNPPKTCPKTFYLASTASCGEDPFHQFVRSPHFGFQSGVQFRKLHRGKMAGTRT